MLGRVIDFFKELFAKIGQDEAIMRAAGVAFYAAFSLAPMVLLFVAITGFMGEGAHEKMVDAVSRTAGASAGQAVETIAAESDKARTFAEVSGSGAGSGGGDDSGAEANGPAWWSLVVSIAIILFSASTVMAAFQKGLNRAWNVKAAPGLKIGALSWLRARLLSMGMVLGICFLLLVSTVATTVIAMVIPGEGWLWNIVNLLVSVAVYILLFAAMFKVLPDVRIGWRQVWFGAGVTAGLFALGKHLIGTYIAMAGYESSYGAAGAVVGVLVWVYYSAIIIFLGAEVTEIFARRTGHRIEPTKHAVRVEMVTGDSAAERRAEVGQDKGS